MKWANRKPLRHMFRVLSGATPKTNAPSHWDGEILWATPEDVTSLSLDEYWLRNTQRTITSEGYQSCGTTMAPPKSIVLTKRAPIGRVALLSRDACTNQGCFLLVPRQETDTRFYYYWLLSQVQQLEALGQGSTFMELSADELKSLSIPHLRYQKQRTISNYLDHETAQLDALLYTKERVLRLLAERRQALVALAVTRGLDRHAVLRESDVSWLGNIPEHWHTERCRWLFKERDERSDTGEEELLTVSHLTGVTPRSEKDVNMFRAATNAGYKICRSGDLAINTMWAWMGAMGVATQDGIVSPAYNVYEPAACLDPRYVDALVRLPAFAREATRHSTGVWSSRLRLYPEGLFAISIPVPPLSEQRDIVAHIEDETRKMDKLLTATKRTIDLLKERRAALISEAVSGQLDVDRAA